MKITISSQPRLLQVLRCVVRWRALEAGFPEPEADSVAMAIDEAAANVIRHTYGERGDQRLTLEIRTLPDRLEFVLEDSGPKVNVERIRPRSLDEVRPGGLGTFFINSFMDSCCFDPNCPEGNRLIMIKHLRRKVST